MRISGGARALAGVAITIALGVAVAGPAGAVDDRLTLEGSLHEHSGYSDGWPGSTPRNYYASGKGFGEDFMGSGEHSDNVASPFVLSEYCFEDFSKCREADPITPADSYRKWPAELEQADAASTGAFTAFRGFEWSSDTFGHVNVYFSSNVNNAKKDGGTPDSLFKWLLKPAAQGGGGDGIATFNHPGAKGTAGSPQFNWNDFGFRHSADPQMVGIETFNDHQDYGSIGAKGNPPAEGWYAHALDRGWHVGAIGAEDLGHKKTDDWGGPSWPKTVVLATANTRAAIKAAMLERRFYAIRRPGIRLTFTVAGHPMGDRFDAAPGDTLHVDAAVTAPVAEGDDLHLDLITSGGEVRATSDETMSADVPAAASDRWYYVRVRSGDPAPGTPIAYSSPVWATTSLAPETAPVLPDPPPVTTTTTTTTTPPPTPGRTTILTAASVRLDRKGRLTVPLRCVGQTACTATTRLAARVDGRTRTIGTAGKVTIGAGTAKSVRITLTAAARRIVAKKGKLAATLASGGATRKITLRRAR